MLAIAIAVAWPSTAGGSPVDLFGFGGRSPGMAGTGVALVTDFDAAWINPAGLADVQRKRVSFGIMHADLELEIDGQPRDVDSVRGVVFGGALPLPLGGWLNDRVGIGLGFHVPPDAINRAHAPFPGDPWFALLETRGHTVNIQVSAGLKVNDRLRVGAGVATLATLDGGIHVFTDAAGRFATRSEQQLVTKFAPIAGARALVPELDLQAGLTVRGETRTDYQLVVTNDLLESLPLTVPTITIGGTSQFDPLTAAFELAWQAKPKLVLLAQVAYQNWSAYRLPTFNPIESAPPQEPHGFEDTFSWRLAAQWTAYSDRRKAVVLRGGYGFIPSPAPEMDGRHSLLDNDRELVSAGLGIYVPGSSLPLHIDFWAQAHGLVSRRHTKDLSIYQPGETAPFYTVDTGGHMLVGGMTVGVDL